MTIVVDIRHVRSHGEPRRTRNGKGDDIGERAVSVVVIEIVGVGKVVSHIEVWISVAITIPPDGRQPMVVAEDACGIAALVRPDPRQFAYIGEPDLSARIDSVVAVKVIELGGLDRVGLVLDHGPGQ